MACRDPNRHYPVLKGPALPAGSYNGKVALVTGGGTGLGKAIAQRLAQLGATVVIASRNLDVLSEAAADIHRQTGAKVMAIRLDVRDQQAVKQVADRLEQDGLLPDVVVNNAAGNFIMATERLSLNAIKTVVDIVLLGTANVTVELGRRLIKAGKGCSFVAISTTYARTGAPFVTPSAAAKAGVENLSRSLAAEWAKYGMRFNCIAPGPIYTKGAFDRLNPGSAQDAAAAAATTVGAGRTGEPEELANLVAYIASDYAS